jgi:transketolase N-terminal domain/subunit
MLQNSIIRNLVFFLERNKIYYFGSSEKPGHLRELDNSYRYMGWEKNG